MPALCGLFIARKFCRVSLSNLIPLGWLSFVECAEIALPLVLILSEDLGSSYNLALQRKTSAVN
jgi:hypothetical protein